jgi:hypothetical protein
MTSSTKPSPKGSLLRRLIPGRRFFLVAASLLTVYWVVGYVAVRTATFPGVEDGSLFHADVPELVSSGDAVVRGALSVHTGRSHDAVGTFPEVAAAAATAGLDFVVLGDHPGDWMSGPDGDMTPFREEGVLVVPGLELVVANVGRTLAVGIDTLTVQWEAGIPALARRADSLGGFVSVVHPRSPKARERWDGLESPGIHAWESFDVSEMARARVRERALTPYRLASFLGGLAVGRGEGALSLMWREGTNTPALLSYDSVRAERPVALTGGLNHHPKARIGPVLFPRYEPFFRTVVNHVAVEGGVEGDPVEASRRLLASLRAGRLFVTLGPGHDAGGFDLRGRGGGGEWVAMGGAAPWHEGATLEVTLPAGGYSRLLVRILRDGREERWLSARRGTHLSVPAGSPGVYRVEVFRAGVRLGGVRFNARPWIISNPLEFYRPSPESAGV